MQGVIKDIPRASPGGMKHPRDDGRPGDMNISSTEAGSPSPVYSRPVDVEAYYAFLLEAIDRFPREGVWIRPNPFYPLWRSHKPAAQVLRASFDRLAKERRPKIVTEFGVHKGISIRGIARALPDASIYGFD